MLQYLLRRLLLVPPTFFFISVVIFLVLNVAPGRPGAQGGGTEGEGQADDQKESYRIFKEQFNLDKPILLNTRFSASQEQVREMLVVAHNLDGQQLTADRIVAQDGLEDFGNYLVRHLIPLMEDADPEVQRLAASYLRSAAQKRYRSKSWWDDATEVNTVNREIDQANQEVKKWFWKAEDSPERIAEVKGSWNEWFEVNRDQYEYTTGESAWIFFFDTRFSKYWSNLVRLDFGVSNVDRRPVLPIIWSKLKYSLSLTTLSVLLAYIIAVPLGIFSAARQDSVPDRLMMVVLFMMYSLPTFFTGTVLLRLLSEGDPVAWFPTGGFTAMDTQNLTTWEQTTDILWHLGLPIATYTSVSLAALSRYARAGVIDVIRADYIRTARAKGLSEPVVILKHAARNGMIPILTLLGGLLPALIGGSVVIEVIFNIPGMGRFLFDSINLRDYNAVMAVLLVSSGLTLVGILLSDLSYAFVDPRISLD